MSGHAPLAPDELAQALTVYRERGTYAAAAAAVGRDASTIRKALRRHEAPERAALFAEELEQAHANALRATRKARRKAVAALADATDPRDIALLAHVCHEGLRAVTTARVAHARLQPPDAARAAAPKGVIIETLSEEELVAELVQLAGEALAEQLDGDARAALAPLVAAAQERHRQRALAKLPPGAMALELPREMTRPREELP